MGGLIVEDHLHVLVEQGYVWRVEYSFDIAAGATHYVGFTTGSNLVEVRDRSFSTEGNDTTWVLYSNTAFTGGANLTITNRNDVYRADSAKNPFTVYKGNVTATPQAADYMAGLRQTTAGQLENSVGSPEGGTIIFAAGTSYVLAITNNTGANRISSFSALCVRRNFSE